MIIGVDTGATKTAIGVFDEGGTIIHEERFPTPLNYADYLSQLTDKLLLLAKSYDVSAVCVALPGVVNDGIAERFGNLQSWGEHLPILENLKSAMPHVLWYIENDANLAGLGEVRQLETTPKSALYITFSTGVGGGMIYEGSILPALQKSEIGEMMIEPGVSWESMCSGRVIAQRYNMLARDITSPVAWRDIAQDIGRGLVILTPVLCPEIIIIGGSIGTYFDRFKQPLIQYLSANLHPGIEPPVLTQAKYPEKAVLYGCYYYAKHR